VRIKDEIFARMDHLSPAEKKVARALLAEYPSAGLTSAATLAKVAGTSTPTVLRLASRLGARSYKDFQQHLLDEVTNQMNSPVVRASQGPAGRSADDVLGSSVAQRVGLIERLITGVPPREIALAVRKLSSDPRHVVVSGGYFSRHIAQIFALQLDEIIPNVHYAADPLGRDISKYLDLRKDSVVVVFDLRRYEAVATELSAMARKQGATVIAVTDEGLSPTARDADIVLPVAVDGIPFDSFAALLVLVECLVEAVFVQVGDLALQRMTQREEAIQAHGESVVNRAGTGDQPAALAGSLPGRVPRLRPSGPGRAR
jgi:DNA-binding MurR/RpiR family transcriptional regulator